MRKALFVILAAAAVFAGTARAEQLTVGNKAVTRTFNLEEGRFRTVSFTNNLTGGKLSVSGPEFEVVFMDGKRTTSDYMLARMKSRSDDGTSFVVSFEGANMKAEASYEAPAGGQLIRKSLKICNGEAMDVTVDSMIVENFGAVAGAQHGGMGQPVMAGDFWFGLESPVGYDDVKDGVVTLYHYPGWKLDPGKCDESFAAAAGVAEAGQIEEAFKDYADSIRYMVKPHLLYNSWYDVRSEGMSVKKFEDVYEQFRKGLGKYGVKLDYLVVDDGWQEHDSIWGASKRTFPDDFKPLNDILNRGGTELGIWLPLCGYGLNAAWGRQFGYEVNESTNTYYCLAGPKYNEVLRVRLRELIEKDGARYFKHDFNFLICNDKDTKWPATDRHSYEANTVAEEGLLDFLHSVNKDVYLNVTSYMWLSPWWLSHADTLWIGSSDYGWDKATVSLEPRDWAINYVDGWVYRRIIEEGARFPINALMTHGIIDGSINRLGGEDEGFHTWADNVIIYLGRGVYMRELYLSPQLMDDPKWAFLSQADKWADSNNAVFARTQWIGGDPRKAEPYGYRHYGGGAELFVLRNPGMEPAAYDLPLKDGMALEQVYPYPGIVPGGGHVVLNGLDVVALRPVDKQRFEKAGLPVVAAESSPKWALAPETPDRLCAVENDSYVCKVRVTVPENDAPVFYAALYTGSEYMVSRVEIDGGSVSSSEGLGWRLFKKKLGGGSRTVTVKIPLRAALESPFAELKYKFTCYLETDQPVEGKKSLKAGALTETDELPPMRDPGMRRVVLSIPADQQAALDFSSDEFGKWAAPTAGDLKKITAAKIRIEVFGAKNGTVRSILLNSRPAGGVPNNNFPHIIWQSYTIDVPETALNGIKPENKLAVSDLTGGPLKFRNVSLAVQLADGTWRSTNVSDAVQTIGSSDWEYAEGPVAKNTTKPIVLKF